MIMPARIRHTYSYDDLSTSTYLRDPALGLVGEVARVVGEELVPEAVVRPDEPLAVVAGVVSAAQTSRRCPSGGAPRQAGVVQEELLLELAVEAALIPAARRRLHQPRRRHRLSIDLAFSCLQFFSPDWIGDQLAVDYMEVEGCGSRAPPAASIYTDARRAPRMCRVQGRAAPRGRSPGPRARPEAGGSCQRPRAQSTTTPTGAVTHRPLITGRGLAVGQN